MIGIHSNLLAIIIVFIVIVDNSRSENQQLEAVQKKEVINSPSPSSAAAAGAAPPPPQPPPVIKRGTMSNLYYSPECQDDIKEYCPKSKRIELNDLSVLQCIYNEVPDLSVIDKECHHLLYSVKKNLTINLKLDSTVIKVCETDLEKFPDCKSADKKNGFLVSCLIGHKDNITQDQCRIFLKNVAALVFSDYRLINNFQEECDNDITKLQCGRIEKDKETPTQQGKTIECLSQKFEQLEKECRKQIVRVTELQSDDFHLDRVLYFACREDREHFCERIQSGNGRVYKCLMKYKFSQEMSKDCQAQLTRRQKIVVQNVDADRSLIRACRKDILKNECRKELRGNTGANSDDIQLASLMLCLERAIKDGEGIEPECRSELMEHRKMLMTDYQLNPNIVKYCKDEINNYCNSGLERGGKTLHCLLSKAKKSKVLKWEKKITFSDACFAELANLVKTVDAGEDIRVDPNLYESCQNLVTGICKEIQPGHGRMIDCLSKQIGSSDMNEECEERLLEIQFFAARDWTLNPELYVNCKEDAIRLCKAPKQWVDWTTKAEGENVILPCLFHHAHDDEDSKEDKDSRVSDKCRIEIKKVMSKRAKSIDLMPEIQDKCSEDLSKFCSQNNELTKIKGEELRCLQKNFKDLEEDCRKQVASLTKEENQDIRLDQILLKSCLPTIDRYCADKREEKGELLECLIKQKNNPEIQPKCKTGIEHHQLLNMQDVSLNYKFKKLCAPEILEHCSNKKSKIEVIQCLSEIVLNDTLLDKPQRITDPCRQQLRFELFQINENINLDQGLSETCQSDINEFCPDVKSGKGRIIECLRTNQKKLTSDCYKKLFKREKMNLIDQTVDFGLQTQCKNAIQQFCNVDSDVNVIACLRKHLLKPSLESTCRQVVINRIMMQNKDARLNPNLWKSCNKDISNFCPVEFTAANLDEELNGRVLKCLKNAFTKNRLSKQCEVEVEEVMREAANVDFRLDPMLAEACLTELEQLCASEPNDKKEQCLRLKFQNKKISKESTCYEEVKRIIVEGAADVFVDHELSQLCSSDLARFCSDIAPGSSQHLKCLLDAKMSAKNKLTERCAEALNNRNQLWKMAQVEDTLTGLNDIAHLVSVSGNRSYLLSVISLIIFMVFIMGCVCRPAVFRYSRLNKIK